MHKPFALLLALAATVGTATAQTAGGHPGGTSTGANGNNNVSSGNSSNTSSSAANSNPTTAAPNYKPAPGAKRTPPNNTKGSTKPAPNAVISSGGQGHNTTPEPKGKVQVAPSVSNGKGSKK